MRIRILEAAKQEFGAWAGRRAGRQRIAGQRGAKQAHVVYHVGNKETFTSRCSEGAYEKIRAEERWARSRTSRSAEGDSKKNGCDFQLELYLPAQSGIFWR